MNLPEHMSPSALVSIIVCVLIVLSFFSGKRRPKERTFRCERCSTVTAHTSRTIAAWRKGKTTFFCGSCHGKWAKSFPLPQRAIPRPSTRSGCLGLVVLGAISIAAMVAATHVFT